MTNRTDKPALRAVRRGVTIVGAAVLVLGLGACRESEQGRPLSLQKGVYQGQKDTPLNEAQLRELQHRGNQQKY